jgi:poly(A) polymerase
LPLTLEATEKPHLHQDWIDPHAYGIVKALQKGGFETYLVGGCVRDLLLNIHPKDFDIATMASPQQVKRAIYMAFIIGKRFRLVLVKRDDQQFEVATFRREVDPSELVEGETPQGDNAFGTPEEDAKRRDFTINGLFYDPVNEKLIDYVGGIADIEKRVLRMIGDPEVRLVEDSIRILRGLRLSHKLGITLDPDLRRAMQNQAASLASSVLPRRREEILKFLRLNHPDLALIEAYDLGVLKYVLPTLHELFENPLKKEIFFEHFRIYRRMAPENADTIHLFGWLVFSYFRTVIEVDEPLAIEAVEESDETDEEQVEMADDSLHYVLQTPQFRSLMRDELGMFNFEQSAISKALQLAPTLEKADEFRKRGLRRQFALLRNEGFSLAMQMAEVDYLLSGEVIQFWREAYQKALPQLETLKTENKDRRKTTQRRRRGGSRKSRGEAKKEAPEASTESAT